MILSMTGLGEPKEFLKEKIMIELKSLNSKSFDLNIRIPSSIQRKKEFEVRKYLNDTIF